ncbi:hypothetical protein DB30_07720 [Enhygromyxa salina]|uniref:Uncharacterized protein n=1 Tax=Enhygromyxa salina TaxID=215803 RepID=A0A0C2DBB9_9BACT|nr:hypothetical protein [Enhygromyxa salina]KIG18705.1 hypothetical protein DB30_07720 [Enhygromyxa salina]
MVSTRVALAKPAFTRCRALALGLALSLPTLGGCEKVDELSKAASKAADPSAPLDIDMAQLTTQFESRVTAAAGAPAVEQAANACFEKVSADPLVGAAGERIMSALAQSPKLAAVGQSIIGALGESKQLQQIVLGLMAENPGMSPDAIGDAVGQRIEAVTSGPAFDRAFDQSFDKVLATPSVVAALDGLQTAIAKNPYLVSIIREAVEKAETEANWAERLTELNGGKRPSSSEATALLLDHWFTTARLEQFYVDLFGLPATEAQVAIAVVALLDSPAFVGHLSDALESMASDPQVQQQIVDVLNTMLLDAPSEAALTAVLDPLLTQPAFATALATLIDALVQDPALAPIGVAALEGIAKDESVGALVNGLLMDW